VEFCIQAKATSKRSYSLRLSDLRKMIDDAHVEERIPLMQIELVSPDHRFAVLRWQDLLALIEQAEFRL